MRKRNLLFVPLMSLGLALAACAPKNMIDADALNGVLEPVLDRHDAYVEADGDLDPAERDTFLLSSELLRTTVDEARKD